MKSMFESIDFVMVQLAWFWIGILFGFVFGFMLNRAFIQHWHRLEQERTIALSDNRWHPETVAYYEQVRDRLGVR